MAADGHTLSGADGAVNMTLEGELSGTYLCLLDWLAPATMPDFYPVGAVHLSKAGLKDLLLVRSVCGRGIAVGASRERSTSATCT